MFEITIKELYAVYRVNMPKPAVFQRRDRKNAALAVKLEGRTLYHTDRQTHVSDPATVVLLRKGASYKLEFAELGECYMVEFDADIRAGTEGILTFKPLQHAAVVECIDQMEREWNGRGAGFRSQCLSLLYRAFSVLERSMATKYMPPDKSALIRPAVQYLHAQYGDPDLRIGDAAAHANISPSYFRRLFTQIHLQSPVEYLRALRINKAKELLRIDGLSISAVAEMVGYANIFYFDTVFKKVTGMTPSEYIQAHRNERAMEG